jgi:hypothetical protein
MFPVFTPSDLSLSASDAMEFILSAYRRAGLEPGWVYGPHFISMAKSASWIGLFCASI